MSRPRIGQILLQAGVCSQQDLIQAWEQKVLFGDRLGTNLLAGAAIEEKTLAQALGFQHQCAAAWGETLQIDPAAVGRLDAVLCAERFVIPHHIDRDVLYLLMRDPDDLSTRKEVAAVTGLAVVPVAIAEARFWLLATQVLGAPASLRPVPLDAAAAVARAKRQAEQVAPPAPAAAGPDLLTEDEFNALYMRTESGEATDDVAPLQAQAAAVNGAGLAPPEGVSTEQLSHTEDTLSLEGPPSTGIDHTTAEQAPMPAALQEPASVVGTPIDEGEPVVDDDAPLDLVDALPPPEQAPMPATATATEDADTLKGGAERIAIDSFGDEAVISVHTDEGPAVDDAPAPVPATTPSGGYRLELPKSSTFTRGVSPFAARLQATEAPAADPLPQAELAAPRHAFNAEAFEPLEFDAAVAALAEVHTRREIAQVVLRYAISRFQRAALLTVHPGAIVGWCGAPKAFHDAVRAYRVERDARTVFALVADSRAHYIGPLQTWRAHGAWVKQTDKVLPRSVAVLPILVRGRVLNVLYGDNGHDAHVESDVGELLILGQRIAQSYEALLAEAGVSPAGERP
jgi:hypothetical protein